MASLSFEDWAKASSHQSRGAHSHNLASTSIEIVVLKGQEYFSSVRKAPRLKLGQLGLLHQHRNKHFSVH